MQCSTTSAVLHVRCCETMQTQGSATSAVLHGRCAVRQCKRCYAASAVLRRKRGATDSKRYSRWQARCFTSGTQCIRKAQRPARCCTQQVCCETVQAQGSTASSVLHGSCAVRHYKRRARRQARCYAAGVLRQRASALLSGQRGATWQVCCETVQTQGLAASAVLHGICAMKPCKRRARRQARCYTARVLCQKASAPCTDLKYVHLA